MLKNLKKVDCVLHVGDQIYPDNEDIAHAGQLFGRIYDTLVRENYCIVKLIDFGMKPF